VQLINIEGLVLLGPGSEWFWSAVSGIVLAVTFVALYRQLRLQANVTAIEQLTTFEAEWVSERLVRNKRDIAIALRDGRNPAALPDGPTVPIFNFWERMGVLAKARRIDPTLLWSVNGGVCETWWAVLRPWVMASRAELGPTYGEGFEWLADVIAKLNRQGGIAAAVMDNLGDLDTFIAALEYRIRNEEALRSEPATPTRVSRRRSEPVQKAIPD